MAGRHAQVYPLPRVSHHDSLGAAVFFKKQVQTSKRGIMRRFHLLLLGTLLIGVCFFWRNKKTRRRITYSFYEMHAERDRYSCVPLTTQQPFGQNIPGRFEERVKTGRKVHAFDMRTVGRAAANARCFEIYELPQSALSPGWQFFFSVPLDAARITLHHTTPEE